MEIKDFLGGTYTGRSIAVDSQQTMNFYPEVNDVGSKSTVSLIGTPGLKLFATVAEGPCRGFISTAGDRLFSVNGDSFVEILPNGTYTVISTLLTASGAVSLAENVNLTDNTTQIMIVDGYYGYIYKLEDNTFNQITSEFYEVGNCVVYYNGYFVQNVVGKNYFTYSALYDGTTWSGDIYAAESSADSITSLATVNNELWVSGGKSTEIWYITGNSDDPFARVNNAYVNIGTKSPRSVCTLTNSIIWLGSNAQGDNIVWQANSYIPNRISNHSIEYLLSTFPTVSDCVCYTYQQEGHFFYVMNFYQGNKTIVYDLTTNLWHERGSWYSATGLQNVHRGAFQCFWNGKNMIGDYQNGKIYEYDLNYYTDNGNPIVRWRQGPHIQHDRRRLFFREFEIDIERGVGSTRVTYD